LLGPVRPKIKGKNPATMLALYFQQFATRDQKIDLLRFLVELLGKQSDRLNHVLTAIENEKKLSGTNEVDQLQAGICGRRWQSRPRSAGIVAARAA
jgi:hypothetical protein